MATRRLTSVLDEWCAAGHHIGGHTHFHACLNWLGAERYIEDIDQSHELIEPWVSNAPTRYFRFAMDMLGDTQSKTDEVMTHLAQTGFMHAPISHWFYDTQFVFPYDRARRLDKQDDCKWLRDKFVETAVSCLRAQVAASERNLGRRPAHISLIHNSPIAADTYDRVLEAYAEAGAEFITLEEAMRDPANHDRGARQPIPHFRNLTQRWAEVLGVEIEGTPPEVLEELDAIAPIDGWDSLMSLFSKALDGMARGHRRQAGARGPGTVTGPVDRLFSVTGKHVVITGGTRGIGLMIARAMTEAGRLRDRRLTQARSLRGRGGGAGLPGGGGRPEPR
jgi:peptidoglycan/xylan/chitin deacetylase (PgdA/CDA1 family)